MGLDVAISQFRFELGLDGLSNEVFADLLGLSYSSYRNVVRPGVTILPKWLIGYMLGKGYVYDGVKFSKSTANAV